MSGARASVEGKINAWVRGFWRLPLSVQCGTVVLVALLGTEGMTLIFYAMFFSDRLALDLFLSGVIAIVVGTPLAYVFMRQQQKLLHITEALEAVSRTDDLTQLLNRRTFLALAEARIASSELEESVGALLYLDVDYFKTINDRWGHMIGDEVLRQIGTILRSCSQETDLVGRLGGEEFAIFISSGTVESAEHLCQRIRVELDAVAAGLDLKDWRLTLSIGVAIHRHGLELGQLLLNADRSLYMAKNEGRDRTVYDEQTCLAA